jgi:hypothetical protein
MRGPQNPHRENGGSMAAAIPARPAMKLVQNKIADRGLEPMTPPPRHTGRVAPCQIDAGAAFILNVPLAI